MSREARRLNELEADFAKLQAHLIPSGGDTRIGCAAGTAGEEYWVRWCWRPEKAEAGLEVGLEKTHWSSSHRNARRNSGGGLARVLFGNGS